MQEKHVIFKDLSPEQRLAALKEHAADQTRMDVPYYFTPDEIEEFRKDNTQISIQVDEVEEEKKDVVSEYNAKIKDLKSKAKQLRKNVKDGKIFINTHVFGIDDQDNRVMNYYDANGVMVYSR